MFHIGHTKILGFWGKYEVSTEFDREVNIFIGKNGTGKTTFINIVDAILRVDLPMLQQLEFSMVEIRLLGNKDEHKTLLVTKTNDPASPTDRVTYKIDNESFRLSLSIRDYQDYRRRISPQTMDNFTRLQDSMGEMVQISSLSVHRNTLESIEDNEYVPVRRRKLNPPIDQRLSDLMNKLTKYRSELSDQVSKVSAKFQRDVLISMLYDENFDNVDIDNLNVELGKEKEDLSHAYQELGAWDEETSERINGHIRVLNNSLSQIKAGTKTRKGIKVSAIMPLPLLKRTQHIINLSFEAEKEKAIILRPVQQFTEILRSFITDKDIALNPNGELIFSKDDKVIPVTNLSSGEKQIVVLLTETMLQKNDPFIFIADEPELSLHIEWQAKVISSVKKLNTNAQVIVATHSPEITGGWGRNIIQMESILHVRL
jgi:predicted ATP-dependent endonuclease of OLD family